MLKVGFEPTIPVFELAKTIHAMGMYSGVEVNFHIFFNFTIDEGE
jgi:hypothetical protein